MSDRVTNIEIEDVLSSIRRLVMEGGSGAASFETRTVLRPDRGEPSEPAPETVPPGRFVLTPALRVAEPVVLRAATTEPPAVQVPWPADEPLSLDIGPDVALPGGDVLWDSGDEPRPSDFADDGDEAGDEPGATVVNAAFLDRRLRLSDMAAGLEAAVTAQPDDWEPDGSEEVPVMDWTRTAAEDAPIFRSRHAAPLRLEQRVPPLASHEPAAAPDHGADLAAAIQDAGDDPDGLAGFDAVANEPLSDELAAYIGNGTVVDEQMLRNLVVEIVRQELQGALGERITRNVRKLVRREIARALSNPDYE